MIYRDRDSKFNILTLRRPRAWEIISRTILSNSHRITTFLLQRLFLCRKSNFESRSLCRTCICFFILLSSFFPSVAKAEIKDSAFKQYDIRGSVETEIDIEDVYDLGRAIACYYVQHHPEVKTLALGIDGRLTSPEIGKNIRSALLDSGINVISIGLCTSPVLYFATETMDVQGGIMVTASHNPKNDNGLKLTLAKEPVCGEEIQKIKNLFKNHQCLLSKNKGSQRSIDITENYISLLANHFKHLKGSEIAVLFDSGNGAAGAIMPKLIEAMEWTNAGLLYSEVDGNFPNRSSDPTKQENLAGLEAALRTKPYDIGIAFDGDGDRMVAMTKNGYLVPGDKLLAIFGKQVARDTPGASIVFDLSCSNGLQELLSAVGAKPIMAPIGAVNVRNSMKANGALLGGEISCHFFFFDRYFGFDDGIYAAMRLVECMHETGENLETLIADFPVKYATSTIRLPCEEYLKEEVVNYFKDQYLGRQDVSLLTLDGLRVAFKKGWGLIRPSNTEPKLSLRFEADTPEELNLIKEEFFKLLLKYFDSDTLRKYL